MGTLRINRHVLLYLLESNRLESKEYVQLSDYHGFNHIDVMKLDPLEHLREISWRRPLTEAEKAELRALLTAHPEAHTDWETEAQISELLGRLPDAPVPSNLTARVLAAIELDEKTAVQAPAWRRWIHLRWLPRTALAALCLGTGLLTYHQIRAAQRHEIGHSIVAVSDAAPPLPPDVLQDFDAIRRLNPKPAADTELLALLQ